MVQTFLAVLALLIAGGTLLALAQVGDRLHGTTLRTPWKWSLAALGWLGLAALYTALFFQAPRAAGALSHLQYSAGVLSFLPWMAVLGASRPRDRGWPVVTVGLLVILLLPSAESWLYRPGLPLRIEGARAWFLLILMGLGLATYAFTRYRASALCVALAQAALLYRFLPEFDGGSGKVRLLLSEASAPLALMLVFPAIALARRRAARRPPAGAHPIAAQLDPLWFDFRDSFGMLWGLRVVERMGASARRYDWPVSLSWSGFAAVHAAPPRSSEGPAALARDGGSPEAVDPAVTGQIHAVFENLLLRFVSPEWIAERKQGS